MYWILKDEENSRGRVGHMQAEGLPGKDSRMAEADRKESRLYCEGQEFS